MESIDNLNEYALILIYSDGIIEKIKVDEKTFHMEYFIELIKSSKRLSEFIKRQNIFISDDSFEFKMMRTIELDTKLALEGVITIHNLYLDAEIHEEISDWVKDFYITMPEELSEKQRGILNYIADNYDVSNYWFSVYQDGKLVDIETSDFLDIVRKKGK